MLPGIRFLFAAVLLTVSLVVFGLGAAALLRSAHEEFAAIPTRRPPPQAAFAQAEAPPSLAMLSVDPPAPAIQPAAPAAAEPAPVAAAPAPVEKPAEPDTVAALPTPAGLSSPVPTPQATAEPVPPEVAKVETAKVEAAPTIAPLAAEPAPESTTVLAAAPAPAVETLTTVPTAAARDMPAVAPQPVASEPPTTLTEDDAKLSSTKIATLGGPPVDIAPVPLPVTRPTAKPVKKKEVKKREVVKKRRVAARTVAAPAPQQLDPFGQPIER